MAEIKDCCSKLAQIYKRLFFESQQFKYYISKDFTEFYLILKGDHLE